MPKGTAATSMVRQTMFTTGEVDRSTWKRTDVSEYLTAAQSLKNCEIGTTGLVRKRKGSDREYNATAYANPNSRMYDFVDKNDNHYILMSANQKFYVFKAPTDQVQVVTGGGDYVVTGRGSSVVARDNGLVFIQEISTPYTTIDLGDIDYTQDNDALILTHGSYPQARIYISNYSPLTFSYQVLDIYPLPAYDFNTINYNSFTVNLGVSGSTLTFQFTGLGSNPGFTTAWIGGQIVGGGATDIEPVGYAIITNVAYSGGTVTFTATIQIPFKTSGYATQGSQYSVKQPSWSAALGYPSKVLFYQNRLWFGNTAALPTTIFGSKINAPINFDVGTGRDTDAIVYTIGQTNAGNIRWLNGGKQLEIYTENYEFACPQDTNTALTPSTFSIRQQSAYGSSPRLKPITYINDSYYANKTGKAFINYHFNGVGLAYQSTNISAASSHLVKSPRNRAILRGSDSSQDNFIYFLNASDNTLTAFQFAAEYKLAALTPIEFQDDVRLIDICTISNDVYILKFYSLSDTYTIERMNSDTHVDGAIRATMQQSGLITGLETFVGYTVQVVFDDQDYGEYLVNDDGEITVNNHSGVANTVTIGLLYDVEIIPMYLFAGATSSPLMKNISRIYVDYQDSLDFNINGKLVPYQSFAEIQAGDPLVPKTDTAIVGPVSGWDRFSTFSITQSSPFDLQITAIAYQIVSAVL